MGYNKWDLLKFIFFHLFQKNYLKMGAAPIFFRKIFFHFGKIYLINFLLGVRGPQFLYNIPGTRDTFGQSSFDFPLYVK